MRLDLTESIEKPVIITLKIAVKVDQKLAFADMQAKMNAAISSQPGFISLEFLSPSLATKDWVIIQRFCSMQKLISWKNSPSYQEILTALKRQSVSGRIEEITTDESAIDHGVSEVIVAEIYPEKEGAYRDWIARIHLLEANFPGFRGVYIQSPVESKGRFWITLLQFDNVQNLEHWLGSEERQKLLEESKSLISYFETHRVISPYAGWFSSVGEGGRQPSVWKQTMIILLVLFPIVMLEFKYLMPSLQGLDMSLGTFIGNTISVSLISFPGLPIVIYFLGWWLLPKAGAGKAIVIAGTFLVIGLYVLEIWLFWGFV